MRRLSNRFHMALSIAATLALAASATSPATAQPVWSKWQPAGAAPSARNQIGVGSSYDQVNDRLIIYSGNNWGSFPNDVWVLKNATQPGDLEWEALAPAGPWPQSREAHVVAYSPHSNRLIVHGGWGPRLRDTWVLTHANGLGGAPAWLQLPSAPVSRSAAATGYDPESNRLIVYGGLDTTYYTANAWLDDVWVLTNADGTDEATPEWIELHPAGAAPGPRCYAASAYDPATNTLIVHGGTRAPGWDQSNDIWVLTHANGLGGTSEWRQMTAPGGPSPRGAHQMAFNASTNRAVVIGGYTAEYSSAPETDVWILDHANGSTGTPSWIPVPASGSAPPFITAFGFAYSPANDRLVATLAAAGGAYGNSYTNDAWRLGPVGLGIVVSANAGPDQVTREGDVVALDGSASTLTGASLRWEQVAGPAVELAGASTATPSFTAPALPGGVGGTQTLTFRLTVKLGPFEETSTTNVTVKNVDHAPVASAGDDQVVNEGSPVTLRGEWSYDPDGDAGLSYTWEQTGGPPVALLNAASEAASFAAPVLAGGLGEATLLSFRLTVSDGEMLGRDEVVVRVEQVNHAPVALATAPVVVDESTSVTLNGSGSTDPDGDPLAYQWALVEGSGIALSDTTTATPTFLAPRVDPGGLSLRFRLIVTDGSLSSPPADVVVSIRNANDPPSCGLARPRVELLWPPNHKMVDVEIVGVTDPQQASVVVSVTAITQDEPTGGLGTGDTTPDATVDAGGALLRAERSGTGNGRVYRLVFVADDGHGEACTGEVKVGVPHSARSTPVDDGQRYDSTRP